MAKGPGVTSGISVGHFVPPNIYTGSVPGVVLDVVVVELAVVAVVLTVVVMAEKHVVLVVKLLFSRYLSN